MYITDFYHDVGGTVLDLINRDYHVPLLCKSADFSGEKRIFAWPEKQLFPLDTPQDVILSRLYFDKTASSLSESEKSGILKRIYDAEDLYGVNSIPKKKSASIKREYEYSPEDFAVSIPIWELRDRSVLSKHASNLYGDYLVAYPMNSVVNIKKANMNFPNGLDGIFESYRPHVARTIASKVSDAELMPAVREYLPIPKSAALDDMNKRLKYASEESKEIYNTLKYALDDMDASNVNRWVFLLKKADNDSGMDSKYMYGVMPPESYFRLVYNDIKGDGLPIKCANAMIPYGMFLKKTATVSNVLPNADYWMTSATKLAHGISQLDMDLQQYLSDELTKVAYSDDGDSGWGTFGKLVGGAALLGGVGFGAHALHNWGMSKGVAKGFLKETQQGINAIENAGHEIDNVDKATHHVVYKPGQDGVINRHHTVVFPTDKKNEYASHTTVSPVDKRGLPKDAIEKLEAGKSYMAHSNIPGKIDADTFIPGVQVSKIGEKEKKSNYEEEGMSPLEKIGLAALATGAIAGAGLATHHIVKKFRKEQEGLKALKSHLIETHHKARVAGIPVGELKEGRQAISVMKKGDKHHLLHTTVFPIKNSPPGHSLHHVKIHSIEMTPDDISKLSKAEKKKLKGMVGGDHEVFYSDPDLTKEHLEEFITQAEEEERKKKSIKNRIRNIFGSKK